MNALLAAHLKAATAGAVDPAISAMAQHVLQQHTGVKAIIAYGSTLRDATPKDSLIDLYILTADFAGVSKNQLARLGCRLVPPNVYYAECKVADQIYRAKYAVMPLSQFSRHVAKAYTNPYFWARFAQPVKLVWLADAATRAAVVESLVTAATTAYAHAQNTSVDPGKLPAVQWTTLFQNTYRTELRPESIDRAQMIVEADQQHYRIISQALADEPTIKTNWLLERWRGKTLSVLRLIKAAFTFQGGADYIAWKIKRHAGVDIKVTDFQRHHPLLAAITLLPQLIRKGAFR